MKRKYKTTEIKSKKNIYYINFTYIIFIFDYIHIHHNIVFNTVFFLFLSFLPKYINKEDNGLSDHRFFMKNYILKHKKELIKLILFIILASISAVFIQFFRGYVLDSAINKSRDIIYYGITMFLLIVLEILFTYLFFTASNKLTSVYIEDLRSDIFRSILSKNYKDFYANDKGNYISKLINEVTLIDEKFFSNLCTFLQVSIKALLVLISIFLLNWKLSIIAIFLMTLPLYIPKLIQNKIKNLNSKYVNSINNLTSLLNDYLSGYEIIHNYSLTQIFIKKFIDKNYNTQYDFYKMRKISSLSRTLSMILSYFSFFIVVIFSTYLVFKGEFTAGEFFAAIGLVDQLSWPIISISINIQNFIAAKPVINSILPYINTVDSNIKNSNSEKISNIVFSNVCFSYNEKNLIKNFNAEFKENKKYLIRGESGSGKTTLINLLLGFEKLDSGNIFINGKVCETEDILGKISIVRQETFLFNDTIRNNISLHEDIEDENILKILNTVNLTKFSSVEDLDTIIENSGINLSGGEKRRIMLARAIIRKKDVLILDEPLANLDKNNAHLIEDLILKINDVTLIVISHTFSEEKLKEFDEIYSLE